MRLCRLRYPGGMSDVVSFEVPEPHRERLLALVRSMEDGGPVAVRTDKDEAELPPEASDAVRLLLADLAAGGAVHLLTDDADLTT